MHAPSLGADGSAFKNIQVELAEDPDIANNEGAFWVQQALYDRLGTAGRKHILTVTPTFSRANLGISAQDVATRYDMSARVSFTLKDAATGDILDSGSVTAVSTFGAPIDPYGRAAAEQGTTKNIAKEAADRILVRLAAYYANAVK
jgi:LPS-assembly lipoprotein